MELKVKATSCFSSWDVIEKYGNKLSDFGATCSGTPIKEVTVPDEDSDERFNPPDIKITVNNLETLRDFIGSFGGKVVLSSNFIEIYDDYRE